MAATSPTRFFDQGEYLDLIDSFYPRFISQIDRDPDSPTYGSCDRGFWMYRLHDFDSGVVQQGGLTLAALVNLAEADNLSGTRYLAHEDPAFWRLLALAVNQRNLKLLGRRGMADEYYPGEQSFPATVFLTYATLKSALMLGQNEVIHSAQLRKAAEEFLGRQASPAANQDTAAAAFLALYSQAVGWEPEAVQSTLNELLLRPSQSGRFMEYGGIDLGYSSVTLNFLGYLHADESYPVLPQLEGLAELLANYITPGGYLGGEFASRSTTYFLPFGFLQAAHTSAVLAGKFAALDLRGVYEKLDDRYLIHYCLPALSMTAWALSQQGVPETKQVEPPPSWETRHIPETNLLAAVRKETAVLVGLNKGGAFQVEHDRQTTIDCGYRVKRGEEVFATCVVEDDPQVTVDLDAKKIQVTVEAPFRRYGLLVPGPMKTIALRLVSFLGPAMNAFFKRVLIKAPQALPDVTLKREFLFDLGANSLEVRDTIGGLSSGDRLTYAPPSSFRVVPSAKFFQPGESDALLRAQQSGSLEGNSFVRHFDLS